jgi:hypothetical protein
MNLGTRQSEKRQKTMIAKNFMKFPEALRFRREMFSNGYHNQPRIMRMMECIFNQRPSAPDWWTMAKAKARDLAKRVKKAIMALFEKPEILPPTTPQNSSSANLINTSARSITLAPIIDHRDPKSVKHLDAPIYMSFCNNFHRVNYAYGKNAPYWGGHSGT